MIKIVKIETGFSELTEAANKSWDDIESADIAIARIERQVIRDKKEGKKFGYYKTDFIITYENGHQYHGRYDIGDGEFGFSNHVKHFAETYGGIKKPAHLKEEEWENFKKMYKADSPGYRKFLEQYQI